MGRFLRLILYFAVYFGVFLSNNPLLLTFHVESVGGLALIVLREKTYGYGIKGGRSRRSSVSTNTLKIDSLFNPWVSKHWAPGDLQQDHFCQTSVMRSIEERDGKDHQNFCDRGSVWKFSVEMQHL